MIKKNIDVLIVARPDHSMQIYNALLGQENLSFLYLSYKIFPKWMKKLTGIKKMTTVTKYAICSWRMTIINLCRFKYRFSFAQKWDETHVFDSSLKRIFMKNNIRIIHYWPEYGNAEINKYISLHPEVKTYADIHMPHPKIVYESMKPVYGKYGILPESTDLFRMSEAHSDIVKHASNILVPSAYVADTYRKVYTNKNYHIISYGITPSVHYSKKQGPVKQFVYAGRISLEKGGDLLLEYFANHPKYTLNIYGSMDKDQSAIFEKYENIQNIIFHGQVPKVELQKEMSKYDVGIHLSRFDAYSLAVGEMIGVGLPVIVSCNTGNKDDVAKYNFGCVTDLNLESVSLSIQTIVDNYNAYIDSISDYIKNQYMSYGDAMVDFYMRLIDNVKS